MSRAPRLTRVDKDILDAIRSLFPGAEITLGRGSAGTVGLRLVPGIRRTHMLVPADLPSAARDAVDRPTAKDTLHQTLRRRAVATVLRAPVLPRVLMPDVLQVGHASDTLLDYLEHVSGGEVRVSMALGARRANRKPVLAVHRRDGREIGYAKVGLTPLANDLIDHEARFLRSLATRPVPRHFRAPQVLHHGGWGASSVLVLESLRPSTPRRSRDLPIDAMAELSTPVGMTSRPLKESEWLRALTAGAAALGRVGRPELLDVTSRYTHVYGDAPVPLGRAHGDFGPWNMAWDGHTPLIWDWERADDLVPVGTDAVHFTCHPALREVGNLDRARRALTSRGAPAMRAVLDRLRIDRPDPRVDRAVVLGYLLAMTARFSIDALRPDGEVVADLARWYLTVLKDQLDHEERTPWK